MIKLKRPQRPIELTEEKQREFTVAFCKSKLTKDAWNTKYIRTAIFESSHHKCCYCEKRIGPGYADMHIDHFKPKSKYPGEVAEWNNLMPACPDCNRAKGDLDTVENPIVNPYLDDPKDHFYLKDCRYKAKDRSLASKGNTSLDALDLNDLSKKCLPRYQVVSELLHQLNQLNVLAKEKKAVLSSSRTDCNRIISILRNLLNLCISSAEYAAFTATALQTDEDYIEIKEVLVSVGRWTTELEELDLQSKQCSYSYL